MPGRFDRIAEKLMNAMTRRRLPVIDEADAIFVTGALHADLDRGIAARDRAAEAEGLKVACARGCSACCENLVMAFEPESLSVARWLARPENREARERFLAAYPAWSQATGDAPERLREHGLRGDVAAHRGVLMGQWRRRIMCAFNHLGECSIYPVRPVVCRNAHALDTAEHCAPGSTRGAATLAFPVVDEFIDRARQLLLAAHLATRGASVGPEPLVTAVYRLLSAT